MRIESSVAYYRNSRGRNNCPMLRAFSGKGFLVK